MMHYCCAPGCGLEVPDYLAFCGRHWRMLSVAMQAAVVAELARERGSGGAIERARQEVARREGWGWAGYRPL